MRLDGLRTRVEQSDKQVKQELGWADWQVRRDVAIRRHWALVCCAFSCCWWAWSHTPDGPPPVARELVPPPVASPGAWPLTALRSTRPNVAWPVALRRVQAWLYPWTLLRRWWRAWTTAPPPPLLQLLLERLWSGLPLDCYAH